MNRHAKALPTGARISKADRKKLRENAAKLVSQQHAQDVVGLEVRQRLNIARTIPGMGSASRRDVILSRLSNRQLASQREEQRKRFGMLSR